jgi:hypothetical protein
MRSPFKYTLNVVCPITESLAGAHTYVTNSMKAGSGGVSGPAVAEPLPELLHLGTATPGVYTTTDLGFGHLDRLVGAIVLQHLLELE